MVDIPRVSRPDYQTAATIGFFGNAGPDVFVISTGTYSGGQQLVINRNGNAAFQGKVEAKNFVVSATPTADHVFASDYNLRGIDDLEKFITEKVTFRKSLLQRK